jgi:hypothetical protein
MLVHPLKKEDGGRGTGRDCRVIEFDGWRLPSRPYKDRGAVCAGYPEKVSRRGRKAVVQFVRAVGVTRRGAILLHPV